MEFKTETQKQAYEKMRDHLTALFGEINVKEMDDALMLQEGSTFIYLRAFPIGENKAGVEVFSYVAVDVDVTEDLMRFLLTYNLKLILGAFGMSIGENGKGTIVLTHTILGDTMERDELYGSVSAIARVSDDMDDQIVKMFGGATALSRMMKIQSPTEVWE